MNTTNHCPDHRVYTKGCTPCRERSNAYYRLRRAALADGTWDSAWVTGAELERVRSHIRALMARPGMSNRVVAEAAGVSRTAVELARSSRQIRCHPLTAQALLAVTPALALRRVNNPRQLVSSIGAARRLQALAVDEWSVRRISELVGIDPDVVKANRLGATGLITWGHHETYRQFYDKVQAQADPRGGSPRAGSRAVARGWVGPEQWEDGALDDPDAEPLPPLPDTDDHVAVSKLVDDALRNPTPGKAAGYERHIKREIARQALGTQLGWTHERVAELLGYVSANSVEYLLNGRKDRPHTRQKGHR